jgi:hypothetical protein
MTNHNKVYGRSSGRSNELKAVPIEEILVLTGFIKISSEPKPNSISLIQTDVESVEVKSLSTIEGMKKIKK